MGRAMKGLVFLVLVTGACEERTLPPTTVVSTRITQVDPAATPTLVKWDLSPPLRDIPPVPSEGLFERERERHPPILRPATPWFVDPVAQTFALPPLVPSPIANFDGIGDGFVGPAGQFNLQADPPDTNGDVGPNHYMQSVNISFAVFSKTGTPLYGPASIHTVWAGFGGVCETTDDGDPLVKYDSIGDRWIL